MKTNLMGKTGRALGLFVAFAAAAALLPGCDREEAQGSSSGAVRFAAQTSVHTRTVFGSDGTTGRPILWSTGDGVFISCAQAASTYTDWADGDATKTADLWAKYVVASGGSSSADFSAPDGEDAASYGIRWSETAGTSHDFYSIYPAGFVKSGTEGTSSVTLTVPSSQECTVTEADNVYKAAPDMEHDLMWGSVTGATTGSKVTLSYMPIGTVIDVTVSNVSEKEQSGISYVSVASASHQLSGDFGFSMTGCKITGAGSKSDSVATATFLDASSGSAATVTLDAAGTKTLNACVILPLPYDAASTDNTIDASDLTVTVGYSDGTERPARLTDTEGTKITLGSIVRVTLALYPDGTSAYIKLSGTVDPWEDYDGTVPNVT